MKIHTKCEIERLVSSDVARTHLRYVYLDTEKKRVMATDGHVGAIVPVDVDDGDVSGVLTDEALKAARKAAGRLDECIIKANGVQEIPGAASYPRPQPEGYKFPPLESCLPDFGPGDEGTVTFGVNVDYLLRVAKAIGGHDNKGKRTQVQLTVKVPKDGKAVLDPILVKTSPDDNGRIGVVMPFRLHRDHSK